MSLFVRIFGLMVKLWAMFMYSVDTSNGVVNCIVELFKDFADVTSKK